MENILDKAYEYLITYGMSVVAAVLIFVIGKLVARLVSKIIENLLIKAKVEKTLASFVKHISYFGLLIFVVIAALSKIGIQTTSFIALIGAAGLAVGLALQGSLSNFAAGVMLIMFKPFKVGDFVETGGVMGAVQEIQIFNTILTTPDNKKVIIPNSKVTGDNIANYTILGKRRVDLVFGISYGDDIQTAKRALEGVVQSNENILKDPEPTIAVSELANSSVNIVCRPWVKPENYWGVYFDVTEKGKIALEKSGITIPFPQQDIHMFEENNNNK